MSRRFNDYSKNISKINYDVETLRNDVTQAFIHFDMKAKMSFNNVRSDVITLSKEIKSTKRTALILGIASITGLLIAKAHERRIYKLEGKVLNLERAKRKQEETDI